MNGRTALILTLLAAGFACEGPQPTDDSGPGAAPGALRSPQALAVSARWILVGNTGFSHCEGAPCWETGSVSFIHRESRRIVGRLPTTQKNPQAIVVVGDRAYVANSGELARDDGQGRFVPASPGGVDVLDLSGDVPPTRVSANIAMPLSSGGDPRVGGFGSLVVIDGADGTRRGYLGSGTRGDVFVVDLHAGKVLRGAERPLALFAADEAKQNGMAVVRPWGERGLAVLDFNGDRLCLSANPGAELADRSCHLVGVNRELLEGPIDVAFSSDGEALVLMTLANAVYRAALDAGEPRIDHRFASTGLANNRLTLHDGAAYVVNSLSNNLQRIDLAAGASRLPFAVLPVGSNPYDLAISAEPAGAVAWVSLLGSHQLAAVDLASGEVLELIGGEGEPVADAGVEPHKTEDCEHEPALVGVASVVAARYGVGAGHGQAELPAAIQGGPEGATGGGAVRGVLSLGAGGELIVDFGDHEIEDGPGADFVVFENPFLVRPHAPNAEPALVAVSATGTADEDFVEFPCDLEANTGDAASNSWPFPGCAGVRPVKANRDNCLDPRDPSLAGGDAFDLADLGLRRARYLRLRDAGISKIGTDARGFDLDAVVVIHPVLIQPAR